MRLRRRQGRHEPDRLASVIAYRDRFFVCAHDHTTIGISESRIVAELVAPSPEALESSITDALARNRSGLDLDPVDSPADDPAFLAAIGVKSISDLHRKTKTVWVTLLEAGVYRLLPLEGQRGYAGLYGDPSRAQLIGRPATGELGAAVLRLLDR